MSKMRILDITQRAGCNLRMIDHNCKGFILHLEAFTCVPHDEHQQ